MWPFSKRLDDVLHGTKKVKIKGVVFRIKKIDPLSYLDGSKAMQKCFEVYDNKKKDEAKMMTEADMKKVKEHIRDVVLAGVVSPKLSRKESEDGFFVDKLFVDWELVDRLYAEIVAFTYGKKKVFATSQKKD